jgi:hypothetical protein
MAAIFGGFAIAPERVVNGFRLRRRQRSQSDIAHKARTRHHMAIVIDMPKLIARMLTGADHDTRGG